METINTSIIGVGRLLKATNGKFAKVVYQKKDGTVNTYTVRTGVKKYVTGIGKFPVPNSITVYSVTAGNKGYKTFLYDGIKAIQCGKLVS